MFELADEEFRAIKDKRARNAEESAAKIQNGEYADVEVTSSSLQQYITKVQLREQFEPFAKELEWELIPFCHDTVDEDFADLTGICELVGVHSIDKFHELAGELANGDRYKNLLNRLGNDWCVSPLFVIQLLVLLERGSKVSLDALISRANWDEPSAETVLEIAKVVEGERG